MCKCMNAMKCDRCGRYYTLDDLPPYLPVITLEFRSGCTIDLCRECVISFEDWIHTDYFFNDQVKRGHGIPASQQHCFRCVYWGSDVPRSCTIGREFRMPTEKICDKWEPKGDAEHGTLEGNDRGAAADQAGD